MICAGGSSASRDGSLPAAAIVSAAAVGDAQRSRDVEGWGQNFKAAARYTRRPQLFSGTVVDANCKQEAETRRPKMKYLIAGKVAEIQI